ncbi:MAG: hypothetical protein KF795_09540 [Labilithrix sp.]|nr:hypothetical protein [Labilithrix sp.]
MKCRALTSLLLGGSLALVAADARAELETGKTGADASTQRDVKPERRNGLTLGASGGIAFAGASGYPNSARFFGNPDFYSSSPLLVGWSSSYFLMGAFNDYVSFGPMVTIATFESEQWKSTGWGAGFRGEVFPLVKLVPALADAAIYGQLGFGITELRAKGPYPSADGSQSFLGIGIHHEWRLARLLGGHAALGPYVEYNAIRAPSAERHWATTGLRVVWYGSGVALDR